MRRNGVGIAVLLVALTVASTPFAQRRLGAAAESIDNEFYFARLAYSDAGRGRGWRGAWLTDYPDAEIHLHGGVTRLTRVDMNERGVAVDLASDDLMMYPWLYAVEVGRWYLTDAEAARLREYLDRGGFLMVDDFWGTYQWAVFVDSMQRVFPDRPIVDIGDDHEIFNVLYELDQRVQIPGRSYFRTGVTWQQDGYTPHWRGIFDDDGRLMVAINFNMDLGDAWEHADDPQYPAPMTALAYRFGVNYVIYSLTH